MKSEADIQLAIRGLETVISAGSANEGRMALGIAEAFKWALDQDSEGSRKFDAFIEAARKLSPP